MVKTWEIRLELINDIIPLEVKLLICLIWYKFHFDPHRPYWPCKNSWINVIKLKK